jgi:hypothetical protein
MTPHRSYFAVLLLCVGCRPVDKPVDSKVALRYHPPAGAVYRYAIEQHNTMTMEAGPFAGMGPQQLALIMHLTQAVTGPADSGVSVRLTFDSTRMEAPGMPAAMMDEAMGRLKGTSTDVVFDPRMRVVKSATRDMSPEMATAIKTMAFAFPEAPVGRGDSWSVETELPLTQMAGVRAPGRTTLTVKEITVAGGDTTVVLAVETTFPSGPIELNIQGQRATLRLAGGLSGDQVFSLTRGTAVTGSMKGKMKMNLSGGPLGSQGMAISADTDVSLRLR